MKHQRTIILSVFLLFTFFSGVSHAQLIFQDDFNHDLDTALWKIELKTLPGDDVSAGKGKLTLKTDGGVTVWLKKKLKGNIRISYDRKVIVRNGPKDRLSDLNQFWMAADPDNADLFTRSGKLEEYDDLQLYYVGMGGNYNQTTRFRKYDGKGNRELLGEYTDIPHLLEANRSYHIDLTVNNGEVAFLVNGKKYFSFQDPHVLQEGYFGFRSTKSNQEIYHLKIYQLP